MTNMQHQFWVTKKCVLRKLGGKEDDCVVSSDAELDAKLELFRSVSESCVQLQRVIDLYQERLCLLAQEENALGRYLKESGKNERNSDVGKSMTAAGKAVAYVGHQRLALRPPLVRLHHEVETFRGRAITDSRGTVGAMEKSRTEYRAALGWMKSASAQLDPESGGLNGFRKAQAQVRSSKANFDRLTLACLQKVDLLAAARCNMFSHALVLYENAVSNFATKAGQALGSAVIKVTTAPQAETVPTETSVATSQDDQMFFNADYSDVPMLDGSTPISSVKETELLLDTGLNHADMLSLSQESQQLIDSNNAFHIYQETDHLLGQCDSTEPLKAAAEYMPSQLLLQCAENKAENLPQRSSGPPNDRAAWFDLFAELDPLANPDLVSGTHNTHAPA